MNANEIAELSKMSREDGKRLFEVSHIIYQICIIFLCIFGLAGLCISIAVATNYNNVGVGFLIFSGTLFLCFLCYVIGVLATHTGKVAVHNLFANLAIIEHLNAKNNIPK